MKTSISILGVLGLAILTGCAVTPPKPITEAEVRKGILINTGYAECPSCSKVKTYSSPPVIDISRRLDDGWINVVITLISTNRSEDFSPRYRLIAKFVNSGVYTNNTDVYIVGNGFSSKLKSVGQPSDFKCFGNTGSGCSWTQVYELQSSTVEKAFNSGKSIELLIGRPNHLVARTNDGYVQRAPNVEERIVGSFATIPAEAIAGFVKGIQAMGAEMPGSQGGGK